VLFGLISPARRKDTAPVRGRDCFSAGVRSREPII